MGFPREWECISLSHGNWNGNELSGVRRNGNIAVSEIFRLIFFRLRQLVYCYILALFSVLDSRRHNVIKKSLFAKVALSNYCSHKFNDFFAFVNSIGMKRKGMWIGIQSGMGTGINLEIYGTGTGLEWE